MSAFELDALSPESRFRAVVSAYEARLGRYALRVCGDEGWAADAVQETFLRLLGADWATVRPKLAEWLFAVCRSRCVDRLRKEGRMRRLGVGEEGLPDRGISPAERAERNEREAMVLAAVASLPSREREVVRLKFQEGMSYREIAGVTGVTESHVGVLIHRGMGLLRRRLAGG